MQLCNLLRRRKLPDDTKAEGCWICNRWVVDSTLQCRDNDLGVEESTPTGEVAQACSCCPSNGNMRGSQAVNAQTLYPYEILLPPGCTVDCIGDNRRFAACQSGNQFISRKRVWALVLEIVHCISLGSTGQEKQSFSCKLLSGPPAVCEPRIPLLGQSSEAVQAIRNAASACWRVLL